MGESFGILIVGAVLLLVVAGGGVMVALALRRLPGQIETAVAARMEALTEAPVRSVLAGPLAEIGFVESLDPVRYAAVTEAGTLALLSAQLSAWASDGTTVTVNGLRLVAGKAEMIVSASAQGRALMQQGLARVMTYGASGQLMPVVIDAETGKVIEIMKQARGAQLASRAAALSSMAVGAAHMIAGADVARRLKLVEGKLDQLLEMRRIDQAATLERIYGAARELVAGELDAARRMELWRLRGELRQLRATWRLELERHLKQIEDPAEASWVKRTFARASADRAITGKLSEGQLQLCLIEYALRLDQTLAVASDSWAGFERSLGDELGDLRRLTELLRSRAALIRGKEAEAAVEPMVSGLDAMVTHYAALLPPAAGANAVVALLEEAGSTGAPALGMVESS